MRWGYVRPGNSVEDDTAHVTQTERTDTDASTFVTGKHKNKGKEHVCHVV